MIKKLSDIYWIFVVIWYLVGVALNVFLITNAIANRAWEPLIVLALWWAVTLTGRAIRHKIEKKRKEKEQKKIQEYREKNIEEISVEDERFGRIVFDYDKSKNTLEASEYDLEKPLGRHELTLEAETEGRDTSIIADSIGYVYDHCDEILEKLYIYTVEACMNYNEKDKDGKPYNLSYVRKNFGLYIMYVSEYKDEVYVNLMGGICGDDGNDLLGCHSVTANVELKKGEKIEHIRTFYNLEG